MARTTRPDADVMAAWQAFLRAHTVLIDELDRELRATHDLPLAWYDVLHQLAQSGNTATMGELSRALLIGGSRCTRRVDQMQAAGLVERRRNELDARVVEVQLTAEGQRLRRRAGATHVAGIQRVFGQHLDPDTAAAMTTTLTAAWTASRERAGERD